MIQRNRKMVLLENYQVLTRPNEKNVIVIWPDLPFWILVSAEYINLLKHINGKTIEQLIFDITKQYSHELHEDEIYIALEPLFLAKVLNYEGEESLLLVEPDQYVIQYITFNITDKCNLFCTHCYLNAGHKNYTRLTFEQAKIIYDKIEPFMIPECNVNLSGGEAVLNKDFFRILEYIYVKGKARINIVSNGTTISMDIAKKLGEYKNISVQVSLDGASQAVHEEIRGKGTYEKTIAGVHYLVTNQVKTTLSPMVTSGLYNELGEYFTLARNLGVKAVFLQPILYVGRAKLNNLQRVNDSLVFKKLASLYREDKTLINLVPGTLEAVTIANIRLLDRCINCGTGLGTLAVQPNGDCYPCPNTIHPSMKCGNILTEGFKEIWNNSPIFSELRSIHVDKNLDPKCKTCVVKRFCGGGCRGQALHNTNDLYGLSPICEYEYEQKIEMLWTAALEPDLFENETYRQIALKKVREENTVNLIKHSVK